MTPLRFKRLLARRGSDLGLWPAPEREASLRLLRRSGASRHHYLAAVQADGLLEVEAQDIDPVLLARLMAGTRRGVDAATRGSREIRLVRFSQPVLRWGALAACALLGVWVGWTASAAAPPPTLLASVQLTPISDPSP